MSILFKIDRLLFILIILLSACSIGELKNEKEALPAQKVSSLEEGLKNSKQAIELSECSKKSNCENSDLRPAMRASLARVADLFPLIWNPEEFENPKNHERIAEDIKVLANNFASLQQMSKAHKSIIDPGLSEAMGVHREMLHDALGRFNKRKKDYAAWRLRGLLSDCMACHTRSKAGTAQFNLGDAFSVSPNASFDSKLAAADFLVASRKYEKAEKKLLSLAVESCSKKGPIDEEQVFDALTHWLAVNVRVQKDYKGALSQLLNSKNNFTNCSASGLKETLVQWQEDLRSLKKNDLAFTDNFSKDYKKIKPQDSIISANRASLVRSLRVTSFFHDKLNSSKDEAILRESVLELGRAYTRIPIFAFEVYREIYLLRTIREYPKTEEAKEAYELYREWIEGSSTGSSGVNLDDEQVDKLKELKAIAYGSF